MTGPREQVLGAIRRSLRRGGDDGAAAAAVTARLGARQRGPIPQRSALDPAGQVDLFVAMAEEASTTVARVADLESLPDAVADFLKRANLPAALRLAPDPDLEDLPWDRQPLLKLESGRAQPDDQVSLTGAFAGIAETGTLLLVSGLSGPSTLNFLPETHIVVLKASQVVGPYEDAWDRLRKHQESNALPRTINLITGPSRTGDIEQTIQLGAHGPRRLHIILVEDGAAAEG